LTGGYRFCCGGTTFTGIGAITKKGNTVILEHNRVNGRVYAKVDKSTFAGTGWMQQPIGVNLCTIADRDTRNNSCICQ
jgi:hypothetical protein